MRAHVLLTVSVARVFFFFTRSGQLNVDLVTWLFFKAILPFSDFFQKITLYDRYIDRYFRKPGNFAVRPVLQKIKYFII